MTLPSYFVHPTAVIDGGAVIGNDTKIWHFSHIMASAVIGERCILGQNVMVANKVVIGNGVKIQNNVSLYEGLTIEDDVFIGPSVVFTNIKNPRSFIERKQQFLTTKIRKGATIGANATILCGNIVGEFAMIGAGAVITKDVPPFALIIGNPSRQIGWVSEYGQMLKFDESQMAQCAESGKKYKLVDSKIVVVN